MSYTYPFDVSTLTLVQQDIADLKEKKKRNHKLGLADTETLAVLEKALERHYQEVEKAEFAERNQAKHEAFLATSFTIGELSDMHVLFLNAMLKEVELLSTWQTLSAETRALAIARIEVVQRLFDEFVTIYNKTAYGPKTNFSSISNKIKEVRQSLNQVQHEGQSLWDIRRYY